MNRPVALLAAVAVSSTALLSTAAPAVAAARPPARADLERALREESGGSALVVSRHVGSGLSTLVGTDGTRPIGRAKDVAPSAPPEAKARGFLRRFGPLLGVEDERSGVATTATQPTPDGRAAVRFRQLHRGVPVLGGDLVVLVEADGDVVSAAGETSAVGAGLDVEPSLAAADAAAVAVGSTAKQHDVPVASLSVEDGPELHVYDPAVLGAPGPQRQSAVWRVDVANGDGSIHDVVLVDADRRAVLLRMSEVETAKTRYVCDRNNVRTASDACTSGYTRTEGSAATGLADADRAYDYSGLTYDFYATKHGRDSLDGKGMALRSTVRYCPPVPHGSPPSDYPCPWDNAYWNGQTMVYGAGFASADDVVAHELTHGVTEHTSALFYYRQSGALNEALSDIFGELIDLSADDAFGNDDAAARWQVGEDLAGGGFRNMADPTLFGDPDRMTSPLFVGGDADNGGVHSNSGVLNKAAFLLTDGGTFNGRTVTAQGPDRVARLFYELNSNLLTSAGDYADVNVLLPQACTNLLGVAGITTATCTEVRDAVAAVELHLPATNAPATEAPVCAAGDAPVDRFFDDLEEPGRNLWAKTKAAGTTTDWAYPQNPNAYAGFDATYATSGVTNLWGDDPDAVSDARITRTAPVAVPTNRPTYLRFRHAHGFEHGAGYFYDGGVVEYSVDAGSTWVDAAPLLTHGGYGGTLETGYGNPLGGRSAFVGESGGYVSSRVDLTSLAGKSVLFRFRTGSDDSYGSWGWFVDDVRVYYCVRAGADIVTNMAGNRGFDVDANADGEPDRWVSTTPADTSRITSGTRAGAGALRIAGVESNVVVSQDITVTPLVQYGVSAYVKIADPAADSFAFGLEVQWLNSQGGVHSSGIIPPLIAGTGGAYVLHGGTFRSPAGVVKARMRFVATGLSATVDVDDAYLGNLLANRGFERDDDGDSRLDAWSPDSQSTRSNVVRRSGLYSIRHQPRDPQDYVVHQQGRVLAGNTYVASAYVDIPTTANVVDFRLAVQWRDKYGTVLGTAPVKTYADDTAGAWDLAVATVVAPAGATYGRFLQQVNREGVTIYVDDILLGG